MRADLAIFLKGQNSGHRAVQKIAVMAHNQNGAVIIGNHLLQQVQRFHVQIIGWFIQHQKVMRFGKQLGQQQAVLFTAGQGGHFLCHLVIIKQEIAQIGGDMLGGTGHLDHIAAAAGQNRPGRGIAVKGGALLVEIGGLESKALTHTPAIRRGQPQQHLDQ